MSGENNFESRGTILVVDDSPAYLRLAQPNLTEHGYTVRMAPNGMRALEYFQIEVPDIILLDIILPDMKGYQVCQNLKAQARTRDNPILFFSVVGNEKDKAHAFAEGGVDFIAKPFLADEALPQRTAELEMFNKAMVDREMRIIEMKEEVNQLCSALGQEIAYPPVWQDSNR